MKNSMLQYSGISTKIKAMESKLINESDFLKIAFMQDTDEFLSFLKKQSAYSDYLKKYDEHSLHRGEIETIITNSKYQAFKKIYCFASPKQRQFLDIYIIKYEIEIVKNCFRQIFDDGSIVYELYDFEDFFDRHTAFDFKQLINSTTVDSFIENLSLTKYYPNLKKIKDNTTSPNLFDYEMALDTYYFKCCWAYKDKYLTGSQQKAMAQLIGGEIDMLNLFWLYRCKRYFYITQSSLYSYIIPISYKIKPAELNKLIEAPTVEDYIELLSSNYYYKKYNTYFSENMDYAYKEIIKKINANVFKDAPMSLSCITNYLNKKEIELDKLTTALECIRYQLEPKETLQHLELGGV